MGWVERLGDIIIFLTLSLLPLKVSPNPTTQNQPVVAVFKTPEPCSFYNLKKSIKVALRMKVFFDFFKEFI